MLQSKLRAGQLDREITFIQKTVTVGTANSDYITGWAIVDTVWAYKRDETGSEVVLADRPVYLQKTTWTIRYDSRFTVEMRIAYNGNIYEIISIVENGSSRDRWLDVVSNLMETETT